MTLEELRAATTPTPKEVKCAREFFSMVGNEEKKAVSVFFDKESGKYRVAETVEEKIHEKARCFYLFTEMTGHQISSVLVSAGCSMGQCLTTESDGQLKDSSGCSFFVQEVQSEPSEERPRLFLFRKEFSPEDAQSERKAGRQYGAPSTYDFSNDSYGVLTEISEDGGEYSAILFVEKLLCTRSGLFEAFDQNEETRALFIRLLEAADEEAREYRTLLIKLMDAFSSKGMSFATRIWCDTFQEGAQGLKELIDCCGDDEKNVKPDEEVKRLVNDEEKKEAGEQLARLDQILFDKGISFRRDAREKVVRMSAQKLKELADDYDEHFKSNEEVEAEANREYEEFLFGDRAGVPQDYADRALILDICRRDDAFRVAMGRHCRDASVVSKEKTFKPEFLDAILKRYKSVEEARKIRESHLDFLAKRREVRADDDRLKVVQATMTAYEFHVLKLSPGAAIRSGSFGDFLCTYSGEKEYKKAKKQLSSVRNYFSYGLQCIAVALTFCASPVVYTIGSLFSSKDPKEDSYRCVWYDWKTHGEHNIQQCEQSICAAVA